MRVTQNMLTNQSLTNLNNNLNRIKVLEEKVSTNKNINNLSDDPVSLSFSLRYKEDLAQNQQYTRNVGYAKSKITHTESMISEVNKILQRARELSVQGATDSNSAESRKTIAAEIKQLHEQLVDVGNSQFNGEYIFNGQMINVKPYEYGSAKDVKTNEGDVKLEVGKEISLTVNVTGAELLGKAGETSNAFKVLEDLEKNLNNNDTKGINKALEDIEGSINKVINCYAKVGAISKRADLINSRLGYENVNLKKLISKTEDANLASVITDLSTARNVHEASLKVTGKILQTNLVDFLK